MKQVKSIEDVDFKLEVNEIVKIGNQAVTEAIAENKRLNLPEFIFKNGKIYFLNKEGELSTSRPASNSK